MARAPRAECLRDIHGGGVRMGRKSPTRPINKPRCAHVFHGPRLIYREPLRFRYVARASLESRLAIRESLGFFVSSQAPSPSPHTLAVTPAVARPAPDERRPRESRLRPAVGDRTRIRRQSDANQTTISRESDPRLTGLRDQTTPMTNKVH
jgi:hypothetical protein